jgi:NodT family efflux transporter outer membrane factor (OMF) lipoprotein
MGMNSVSPDAPSSPFAREPGAIDRRHRANGTTGVAAVLALLLSGCVGPNFVPPAAPAVEGYLPGKLASPNPGPGGPKVASQHFVTSEAVSARWWTAFRSQPLNDLIRDAVNHSPTLQSAEAAIKVAQYNALAQRGLFFPQVGANYSPSIQQISGASTSGPGGQFPAVFSLHTAQVLVSFVPDVWGANVRAVENLDALTEAQLFQLEAAYLTLTSNVVTAAIEEASLRGQIEATKRVIAIERHLLDILKRQFDAGQAAKADVLAQEAALAAAEQLLPPLEKQLAQQRDLLTALAGQLSSDEVAQKFDLGHLKLPTNLPVSLPSKLVDQRPDVRAAEANMHAASAQIGVAIAARLPSFTISGNAGATAFSIAELFTPGTNFYTLAGSATQPIFDGFTLYHKQKAAEAGLDQAEAEYRATVITAFQNVADALRALQADARAVQAAAHAEETAKASLDIVEMQLNAGQVNQLAVLNAQQTYLTAVITHVQAQANRLSDTAALFMALGGGWPTSCTTKVWRECAMGEPTPVASAD